ncbi:MAG: response regulator [bacterium]
MNKVLVVEDDRAIREMCTVILEGENYTVLKADNGKEATKVLDEESDIDLIITDIIMPEKEGIQFIREVKRTCPDIKILAISGGGAIDAKQYLELAQNLGADSILEKPFDDQDLLEAIDKIKF